MITAEEAKQIALDAVAKNVNLDELATTNLLTEEIYPHIKNAAQEGRRGWSTHVDCRLAQRVRKALEAQKFSVSVTGCAVNVSLVEIFW